MTGLFGSTTIMFNNDKMLETDALPRKCKKSCEILSMYDIPQQVQLKIKQDLIFEKFTECEIQDHINEFKKFVALLIYANVTKNKIPMPSKIIDQIWHIFILDTIEYRIFCKIIYGKYLDHIPNISGKFTKLDSDWFYKHYVLFFGPLHPIWLENQKNTSKNDGGGFVQNETAGIGVADGGSFIGCGGDGGCGA